MAIFESTWVSYITLIEFIFWYFFVVREDDLTVAVSLAIFIFDFDTIFSLTEREPGTEAQTCFQYHYIYNF